MDAQHDFLYDAIMKDAAYIGVGNGYNSDIWELLTLILARYEQRGNNISEMINYSAVRERIARHRLMAAAAERKGLTFEQFDKATHGMSYEDVTVWMEQ